MKKISTPIILLILLINNVIIAQTNEPITTNLDSTYIVTVRIEKIEFSKFENAFYITASNLNSKEKYIIVTDSKSCSTEDKSQKLKKGKKIKIDIIFYYGKSIIISDYNSKIKVNNKWIEVPGKYFSHFRYICISPTINSYYCIDF
jgi:hypothetical protein